ncbi:hypothetical protein GYN14_04195 [Lactococcus piscium]|uniref:capsular polysaccharide synthesis protein n=1 Tax=Pseudolactococcus carnosus TaxID=2749961 RepID=UPI001FBB27B1|nr:capsular polysaccharide synthesis protein [Lactococcus carnosus]MCJ1991697.1 hypothetical protein [Lactococcus carnosus]
MRKKLFFIYLNIFDKVRRIIKSYFINQIFHNYIVGYLEKNYEQVIMKYSDKSIEIDVKINSNVWMMWWQGEENAPDLVKRCIYSVRDTFGDITVISQDNFKEYVTLPDYILEKQEEGIIGLANFSDIMRFNLLASHGGLWIDATIFLKNFDPNLELKNPYFTIKGSDYFNNKYVPQGKWRGFFQYGQKDLLVFKFSVDIFNEYWKNENQLINFFLIDYILEIAYRNNIGNFRDINNRIKENNLEIYKLDEWLLEKNNININFDSSHVFKLNTKHKYPKFKGSNYIEFIKSKGI